VMQQLLSGLLYVTYVAYSAWANEVESTIWIAVILALPVMCIWFAEQRGDYVGLGEAPITKKSPSIVLRGVAWIVLLIPLPLVFWYGRPDF
jgi:hypothetical protein